jgi:beta-N-acetylhexosaminidase
VGLAQAIRPPKRPSNLAPIGSARAAHIQDRYQAIARELSGYGIDVNCAPCLDIARAETHPILQNRCFSNEAAQVAMMGAAAAQGLADEGVLPVLKHMPGHGLARVDSHLQLPRVGASLAELRDNDFKPFAALKDWPMAMSAHVVYEVIDDLAATISPKMITLIREEIGFDGLLMTDDISMDALGGSLAERSTAALAAGCDVILHCNGGLDDMQQIAAASGVLSPEGQRRAFAALHRRSAPLAKDG